MRGLLGASGAATETMLVVAGLAVLVAAAVPAGPAAPRVAAAQTRPAASTFTSAVTTSTPRIKLAAMPKAARVGHVPTVRGSIVCTGVSATDTVVVSYARLSVTTWVSVGSTSCALALTTTTATFAKTLRLSRGYWRLTATLPSASTSSSAHATATASARIRVVGAKVVALTFDDGPWPNSTNGVRTTLRRWTAPATFFVLGTSLRSYRRYSKAVVAEPVRHQIGNHTYHHYVLPRLSSSRVRSEIYSVQKMCRAWLDVTPHYFRPPYGSTSPRVASIARSLGLVQVIWTVDPRDWATRSASTISSRVLGHVRPNSVVLMHDGGGNRSGTVRALPTILKALRSRGYDFVTLDELAALRR